MIVLLHQHYLVCHPGLTSTMLMQGVAKLTNDADSSAIEHWCYNLHSLSRSQLQYVEDEREREREEGGEKEKEQIRTFF